MMLLRLIVRRLAFLVVVLLGLSLITLASHTSSLPTPRLYAGPRASGATVQQIRHQFGFDQPIWTPVRHVPRRHRAWRLRFSHVTGRSGPYHDYLRDH
jgi:ABC-type dipeptide/oligopeptide/nickel transport system permease component